MKHQLYNKHLALCLWVATLCLLPNLSQCSKKSLEERFKLNFIHLNNDFYLVRKLHRICLYCPPEKPVWLGICPPDHQTSVCSDGKGGDVSKETLNSNSKEDSSKPTPTSDCDCRPTPLPGKKTSSVKTDDVTENWVSVTTVALLVICIVSFVALVLLLYVGCRRTARIANYV